MGWMVVFGSRIIETSIIAFGRDISIAETNDWVIIGTARFCEAEVALVESTPLTSSGVKAMV